MCQAPVTIHTLKPLTLGVFSNTLISINQSGVPPYQYQLLVLYQKF